VSWDADLTDDRGHVEREWNYTHNCNGMANAVLTPEELHEGGVRWWAKRNRQDVIDRAEADGRPLGSWWDCLDGMEGPEGAAFLDRIIRALEGEPERFVAMNPENGWGDYDSFLKRLTEMRDAVPEWPTKWTTSG
jgi:hypothetical protein